MASSVEMHIVLRNIAPRLVSRRALNGCAWISTIGKTNRHDQSHFFHLKNASGPIAATTISTTATRYPYCHFNSGMISKFMP